jgi:hypothetical protein
MWHTLADLEMATTAALCLYAVCFGGIPDRLGSIFIILSYVAASVLMALTAPHFPTIAIFVCDFALALGLLLVAVRFGNIWLGCAMFLEGVNLFFQALNFAGLGLSNFSQITLNNLLSLLMCACVAAGAFMARRAPTRAGVSLDTLA